MLPTGLSPASELRELSYRSAWLMGAGDGDPCHLSQLAVRALDTADAVICDPGIPQQMLDFAALQRYCEAAAADQAVQRAVKARAGRLAGCLSRQGQCCGEGGRMHCPLCRTRHPASHPIQCRRVHLGRSADQAPAGLATSADWGQPSRHSGYADCHQAVPAGGKRTARATVRFLDARPCRLAAARQRLEGTTNVW